MRTPARLRIRCLLGSVCLPLVLLSGCKEPPTPPKKVTRPVRTDDTAADAPLMVDGIRVELGNVEGLPCRRTLCLAGPQPLDSTANRDLGELCRRAPGVVERCEGEHCTSVWPSDNWQQALDALLGSLDQNRDGKVDDRDPACPISLGGWSTGAAIVAKALPDAQAERASGPHAKVRNLLAIAPYQPNLERLDIATNVDKAFIYRSSLPKDDCSREFENGPWRSPPVVCSEHTTCYDYDYSQDPGDLAYLSRRGARSGAQVGHCTIPSVVAKIGADNLVRGQEALRQLIPPYVDGTHGGREATPRPDPIVVLPNPK